MLIPSGLVKPLETVLIIHHERALNPLLSPLSPLLSPLPGPVALPQPKVQGQEEELQELRHRHSQPVQGDLLLHLSLSCLQSCSTAL